MVRLRGAVSGLRGGFYSACIRQDPKRAEREADAPIRSGVQYDAGWMRRGAAAPFQARGVIMATKSARAAAARKVESIYKIVEVVGTSTESWEDAARNAVKAASSTLRDLRIAEVVKQDMTVKNGKIMSFRTRVLLSFKYDA